jgi:hypothetical protein
MTKDEFFNRVYNVLAECCNVQDDKSSRATFVFHFCGERPTSEYRFMGALGFGGKFRFPGFTVDCYPEDSNPRSTAMIAQANAALIPLRAEYEAAQSQKFWTRG